MMEREIRTDRIFPLRDASFYPGKRFCDMVYFCPPEKGKKRLWLLTQAKGPVIYIDHHKFEPQDVFEKSGYRWIDFGITETELAAPRGFGHLKFYGITREIAENSYFVITPQVNLKLSGSIEGVERKLFGITRNDAGYSFINPSTVEVGNPVRFRLIYTAGEKGLPEETFLRLSAARVFDMPKQR